MSVTRIGGAVQIVGAMYVSVIHLLCRICQQYRLLMPRMSAVLFVGASYVRGIDCRLVMPCISTELICGAIHINRIDWWCCLCQCLRLVVLYMSAASIGGGVYVSGVDWWWCLCQRR